MRARRGQRLITVALGVGLAGAQSLLSTGIAQAQHNHTVSVPVNIGPLVLRVALLIAVPVVAGFAMLRGFLGEPDRRAAVWVTGCAAGAVFLEFMLAAGMDFPSQAVLLVLAALGAPMFLILSRDPRFETVRTLLRRIAPWVVTVAAALACVEFVRAALRIAGASTVVLPTGVVLALIGLSWFTVCPPGNRVATLLVRLEAAVLANAVLAGSAYTLVLTLPR
jgi:hypothetical protein